MDMNQAREEWGRAFARWSRFLLGGVLNTGVTYAIYLLLSRPLGYQVAFFVGYIAGIIFSYVFNAKVVFRSALSWRRMMAYPLVYVVQYAASAVMLGVFVELLNLSKLFAPLLVAVATLPLTYLLSRLVITKSLGQNTSR
jgi:putative flippase GtrA